MDSYVCEACGNDFRPKDKRHSRFCSPECVKAWQRGDTTKVAPSILINSYDDAWGIWKKAIGMSKSRYEGAPKKKDRKTQTTLVISDLHAPFTRYDQLDYIIKNVEADRCVVIGDLPDSYSFSTFLKYEHVPWQEEWAHVTMVVEKLSAAYPEVILLEGNHGSPRLEKRLREQLTDDMIAAVMYMTGGTLSPLEVLTKQYKNVKMVHHQVDAFKVNWLHQQGDVIFSHAEHFSKVPASTVRQLEDWLANFEMRYNLEPYRVVFQAHTHGHCFVPLKADKYFIESGCLCKLLSYQTAPKIAGRPQRNLYITFKQTDGLTDINSLHTHIFED